MKNEKNSFIDDAQIIELYESGQSQQDIAKQYNVSAVRTRAVLTAAGYDTSGFRRLNKYIVDIIISLVKTGASFIQIERICDISRLAVRDIVIRYDLQYVSKTARKSFSFHDVSFDVAKKDEFIGGYISGNSFCFMCHKLGLSREESVAVFYQISLSEIAKHQENMIARIIEDSNSVPSVAGIARKNYISQVIVRNILKNNKS